MENFIQSSARIIGKVRLGENAYVSQGTVVRSIDDSVSIGNSTMVLENSVVIGTGKYPVQVGSKTVFGHKCTVVGAQIGDLCEIGNASIFLPGSKVGNMCMFGEGTLVSENMHIPDYSVVVGKPAKIIRTLTLEDRERIKQMRRNDISIKKMIESVVERDESVSNLYVYGEKFSEIAETAIVFDSAEITGDVKIGEHTIIGSGVKIIGDSHGPIVIGDNVHVLENTVLHLLPGNKLIIHNNVTIGPNCMVHGTIIGENSIIESGAIVCDNSILGENTRVKSGSLVKQRDQIENNAVVEGFPAKEIKKNSHTQEKPDWAFRNTKE